MTDKRFHLRVQGFTNDLRVVAKTPGEAINTMIRAHYNIAPGETLKSEQWPGDSNTHEVSCAGQRVATVTIVGVDE